ncbi:hypothetical protein RUND412_000592 [Rhizina undulata]
MDRQDRGEYVPRIVRSTYTPPPPTLEGRLLAYFLSAPEDIQQRYISDMEQTKQTLEAKWDAAVAEYRELRARFDDPESMAKTAALFLAKDWAAIEEIKKNTEERFKGGSYLIRKARIAHIDLLHQVNDMGRLIDDIKKKLREQKQMNQGRRKYPEGTSEA